jgi:L-fucono-1,5-lactonase
MHPATQAEFQCRKWTDVPAPRIDSHQHFWRYDAAEYGWIDSSLASLRRDCLPPDSLAAMRTAGFEYAVAVQARQTLDETRSLLALADQYPFIAGVVGWLDLQARDVDAQLRMLAGHPKLVGVRHIVQAEPDGFLARADLRHGIARLEHFGLAYDILVYARQLPQAIEFAASFPGTRFVLDHLGKPEIRSHSSGGSFDKWRACLDRLAALPNVCAKLSGLVTEADRHTWTPAALRVYVHAALDAFGADRLMIGSDWPVCTAAGTYRDVMDVVTAALEGRTAAEREAVLGGTAQRFWNLAV